MADWHLIQTLTGADRYAEASLTAPYRACIVFFPKIMTVIRHAGRRTEEPRPFLPRYGFVQDDLRSQQIIKTAPGVSHVVRDACQEVTRAVAEIMKRMVNGFVVLDGEEPWKPYDQLEFYPGEAVRVTEGPFASFNAIFQMKDGMDRGRVLVDIFGRQTPTTVGLRQLERA